MPTLLRSDSSAQPENEPILSENGPIFPNNGSIFIEEQMEDGTIRYHMNDKIRKNAEAAVLKLRSQKIVDFEQNVMRALRSAQS
ncbi:MAG: hypothetical protein OEU92_23380 [Alphaproteobacteria bacterium]|nr:hypothetical protein [Alphaproteobacteria bacterium]